MTLERAPVEWEQVSPGNRLRIGTRTTTLGDSRMVYLHGYITHNVEPPPNENVGSLCLKESEALPLARKLLQLAGYIVEELEP